MGEFWKSSQVRDGSNFLVPLTLLWDWVRLGVEDDLCQTL